MAPVFLFHYTDPESLEDIVRDGLIRPTPAGDRHAHYGGGVYLTELGPRAGRQRLILNNYRVDNADPNLCPNLWAKTSVYIRVLMDHLPKVELVDPERGIYVNKKNINVRVDYEHGPVPD